MLSNKSRSKSHILTVGLEKIEHKIRCRRILLLERASKLDEDVIPKAFLSYLFFLFQVRLLLASGPRGRSPDAELKEEQK